jgi:hypothetical protein
MLKGLKLSNFPFPNNFLKTDWKCLIWIGKTNKSKLFKSGSILNIFHLLLNLSLERKKNKKIIIGKIVMKEKSLCWSSSKTNKIFTQKEFKNSI